jgi:carboxylesterase type B
MSASAATQNAEAFMARLELKANQVDALQTLPMEQLIAALQPAARGDRGAAGGGGFAASPVVDGTSLPHDVFSPTATPLSAAIPLLIGSNETEVTWSVNTDYTPPADDAALRERVKRALRIDEAHAESVATTYRSGRPEGEPSGSRADHRDRRVGLPDRHRHASGAEGGGGWSARLHVPFPVVFAGQRRTPPGDALHGHSVRVQHRRREPVHGRVRTESAGAVGENERRVGGVRAHGASRPPAAAGVGSV